MALVSITDRNHTIKDQSILCKGTVGEDLVNRINKEGGQPGHQIQGERYLAYKRQVLAEISRFNHRLEEIIDLLNIEGSQFLLKSNKLIKYYKDKFPARFYRVTSGETNAHDNNCNYLRPAACANALEVFSNRRPNKNLAIHELGSCFRLERTGECRRLRRLKRFVMPDYHALIDSSDIREIFQKIYSKIWEFYELIGLKDSCFSEIYRLTEGVLQTEGWSDIGQLPLRKGQGGWIEYPEPNHKPYFKLKYEVCYHNTTSPIQLGTIQIDRTLPEYYGLEGKVLIHFSMGSIERIIATLLYEGITFCNKIRLIEIGDLPPLLLRDYQVQTHRVRGTSQLVRHLKRDDQIPSITIIRGKREVERGIVRVCEPNRIELEVPVDDLETFLARKGCLKLPYHKYIGTDILC